MDSTGYILKFTLVMTTLAALMLAGMLYVTEPAALKAEAVFNKRAILSAVEKQLPKSLGEMSDEEVLSLFSAQVEQHVVNVQGEEVTTGEKAEKISLAQEKKKPEADRLLPVFIFKDSKEKIYFILSVRGSGLWDEIWGFVALESDLNSIAGISFDHKAETPGLGAEIKDNPAFPAQFFGKKIYNDQGELVAVEVRKGGAVDPMHDVDAISGATITGNGVTEMLQRGLGAYEPYIKKKQGEAKPIGMK
ncbi:MAG: NADH:ubiquinone reductase (Na(+)-transporting) subunit C [Saprospiraceae bacterium]|nr:NADH:ubiquinone reductase (Na(+)-transporting) subunit C [Saprospiraceae bacterium]